MTIDVIIPTCNPDEKLGLLLGNLQRQSIPPHKIYIINTLTAGHTAEDFNAQYQIADNIEIRHIQSEDFDHGTTRNDGARMSDADLILFITQDAIPADDHLLENLSKNIKEDVVIAFGRQVADSEMPIERLSRNFNYPPVGYVKSAKDKAVMGIKVCFCSNVCAMYRRSTFWELNGFPTHNIFNEDMQFAYKVISSGYSIAYAADAVVLHSHNYSLKKIFQRYFDQGVSQKQNEQMFNQFSSMNEGKAQAKYIIKGLSKEKRYSLIFLFVMQSLAKLCGFFMGKHYNLMPHGLRKALSMNKYYWKISSVK